ncbi:short-chain dehydrogenase [Aspergillus insuetus]
MGSSASKAGGTAFNPAADIRKLTGKTILITGGNSGLGRQSIIELFKHYPRAIWLAARTLSKAEAAIKEVKNQSVLLPFQLAVIKPLEMDLASMDSVARAAEVVRTQTHRLDILILNVGIMATPPGVSRDGYEIQFATNYLGHVFLVSLLQPVLLAAGLEGQQLTGGARAVLLSSVAHSSAEGLSTVAPYGQSKLAVLLYGRELARGYPEFTVVIVHPGQVRTNLGNTASSTSLLMRALWTLTSALIGVEPGQGVLNQLWAATVLADRLCVGAYCKPVGKLAKESKMILSDRLARELWNWTCGELSRYQEHLDGQ